MFNYAGEAPSSVGELLDENPHPFFQPIRRLCTKCVNPDCINTRGLLPLTPVCCCNSGAEFMRSVFHDGEGSSENIQLAFLACPLCETIQVIEFWES
ncbi:hypothetical protein KOR42_50260 [Thalassoglobus neptunius]|uniref:Uncharacterized protein n=1 Tax=Thalassoglobus neptunius TaxID=1938619 RepID=A0A5C5VQX2_9PLAN|nr:hypothetical protein KOR42_50260 [Thalassoglobus neptunius]